MSAAWVRPIPRWIWSAPGTCSKTVHGGCCERLGSGDLEWARGQAWAFEQAMGLIWYYVETFPEMSRIGGRTLERIMADHLPA